MIGQYVLGRRSMWSKVWRLVVLVVLALSPAAGYTEHARNTAATDTVIVDATTQSDVRPNFLVIVVDDVGYSDLSAFGGGEIRTPLLDKLANESVRLGAFYTAPTCSPTRAALLSGTDPHIAGLGNMAELIADNQRGKPGYEGYLNARVVSVATLLRDAGYFTAMAGKWHLGLEKRHGPRAKGFERSFALLDGGAAHFDNTGLMAATPVAQYREDGEPATWPTGRYSSDFYTDKLLGYLHENADGKPFFAYLAFSAAHWPLQAPEELIRNYRGVYDEGWDVLLERRRAGLRQSGLLDRDVPFVAPPDYRPWNTLSQEEQSIEARKMEIYAAMVDSIDRNVGRVLQQFEQSGVLRNTVIIFLSDNGAEGTPLEHSPMLNGWLEQFDNSLENMGHPGSYVFYGPGWAHASTAPGKHYKSHVSEGGIHTAAFIWRSDIMEKGAIARTPVTVMDIAPTVLDLAGVSHPETYRGRKITHLRGRSLVPLLKQPSARIHPADTSFGFELFGRRALRQGDWKVLFELPPFGTKRWELYNLKNDPGETRNVAEQHPKILARLVKAWQDYADEVGVVLPEGQSGY